MAVEAGPAAALLHPDCFVLPSLHAIEPGANMAEPGGWGPSVCPRGLARWPKPSCTAVSSSAVVGRAWAARALGERATRVAAAWMSRLGGPRPPSRPSWRISRCLSPPRTWALMAPGKRAIKGKGSPPLRRKAATAWMVSLLRRARSARCAGRATSGSESLLVRARAVLYNKRAVLYNKFNKLINELKLRSLLGRARAVCQARRPDGRGEPGGEAGARLA
jgi:hypothetical protein